MAAVAKRHGISEQTIYTWRKAFRCSAGERCQAPAAARGGECAAEEEEARGGARSRDWTTVLAGGIVEHRSSLEPPGERGFKRSPPTESVQCARGETARKRLVRVGSNKASKDRHAPRRRDQILRCRNIMMRSLPDRSLGILWRTLRAATRNQSGSRRQKPDEGCVH